MRLPCGHYGDTWEPDAWRPNGCTDPDCAGGSPDPWLMSEPDADERLNRKRETRDYRQAKFRNAS